MSPSNNSNCSLEIYACHHNIALLMNLSNLNIFLQTRQPKLTHFIHLKCPNCFRTYVRKVIRIYAYEAPPPQGYTAQQPPPPRELVLRRWRGKKIIIFWQEATCSPPPPPLPEQKNCSRTPMGYMAILRLNMHNVHSAQTVPHFERMVE